MTGPLEQLFAALVGELVREELKKAPAGLDTARPGWMTPPKAAEALGVPLKRVRKVLAAGRARTRPCSPLRPAVQALRGERGVA